MLFWLAAAAGGWVAVTKLGWNWTVDHWSRMWFRAWQGQVSALAINTNNAGFALPKIDLPLLPDLISGSLGPLVGVLTAMRWAAEQGATHVLTAPVDTPYLPLDLTRRLAAAARAGPVIARSNGWDHPVIGLWPVSLSATLEVDILQGQRRIGQWAKAQGGVAVAFETRGGQDPFFNVNTPEDLAELSQTTRLPGPAT